MAELTMRTAAPDDAPEIARVHVDAWRSAYIGIIADEILDGLSVDQRTCGWTEVLKRNEQATFVAEFGDHGVVGFVNGGPERDGRTDFDAELYAVYIQPEWQGRGIGRELTMTFVRWLIETGFHSMILWVLAQNTSRGFDEHLGGQSVGEKTIDIGSQTLSEVAYGWTDLGNLAGGKSA